MSTLKSDLQSFLRPDQVSDNVSILAQHSRDESYHEPVLPDVVVFPESTDDVVKIVSYASANQIPIVPFGTGTSLEGHVVPIQRGISMDMMRMNKVLEVRPDDFLVCVQPGVLKEQLNEELGRYGLFFAVDPGANASLGGMAATNASGTTTVRYGAMRDNVRSLEVVLPNGTVIHTASLAAKSSSGYNLTGLFVGSEGTLGVITELWVRVWGIPEKTIAARAEFPDVESCVRASTAIVGAGIPVVRMELVDGPFVEAFNKYTGSTFSPNPTLFLEFNGNARNVEADVEAAMEIIQEEGCTTFDHVSDDQARHTMWETRHNALYAFMHQYPGYGHMSTDVCVPVSKLPAAVVRAKELLDETGARGAIVGHVGDGNFHVTMAVRTDDPEDVARANRFNEALVHTSLELGGTCTGEHGVGLGKMKYQEIEHGEAISVMRAIHSILDPLNIMNPGKLVDSPATVESHHA
ncbi:FAD-binding oxidoreductase [Alicyclobacillus dauci]|uniref:D-lactate dehydrogenase (cytochrome) n=1 Tax=Alicyclobacillus dauci TaxID=1475485 RepID=A0ABY6Z3F1_9BACL|nr:FAD-linked oxidase C-terminal domain-containing protein [Alicyclobacillus dauci]WAH36731.1 FAD-binding protein [Alicyclobacillus dauci]